MARPNEFFTDKLEWDKKSLRIDGADLVHKKNFWVCTKCEAELPVEKDGGKLKFVPPEKCASEDCSSRSFSLRSE